MPTQVLCRTPANDDTHELGAPDVPRGLLRRMGCPTLEPGLYDVASNGDALRVPAPEPRRRVDGRESVDAASIPNPSPKEDAIERAISMTILFTASLACAACVDDDGTVFNGTNGDTDASGGGNGSTNGGDGPSSDGPKAPLHGLYEVVQHTESDQGCGDAPEDEDIRRSDYLFLDSSITDAFDVLRHDYNGYQCSAPDLSSCTEDGYLMFWVNGDEGVEVTDGVVFERSGAHDVDHIPAIRHCRMRHLVDVLTATPDGLTLTERWEEVTYEDDAYDAYDGPCEINEDTLPILAGNCDSGEYLHLRLIDPAP